MSSLAPSGSLALVLALALPCFAMGALTGRTFALKKSSAFMSGASSGKKVAIFVEVEIDPKRLDDFLRVIEEDAVGSRERENGGCLRFDVIRDQEKSNVFRFYELYTSPEAVAFHKATPHFALWKDFKASGGVLKQVSSMNEALFVG
jgi:quinol monooxygenase YgiN